MDTLPNEIIHVIFNYLPSSDIKCYRQTCKSYSKIGEEIIFSDFEFKLYPAVQRLDAFTCMTKSPLIARRLRCVSYESGILPEWQDYRLWEAAEYSRQEADFSRRNASKTILRDLYGVLRKELNERFSPALADKYDQYRWWLDCQATIMSKEHITDEIAAGLRRVSHIEELKLVMKEPIVRLEDLEQADEAYQNYNNLKPPLQELNSRPSECVQNRRAHASAHFCSLLRAAHCLLASGHRLPNLTHITTIDLPRHLLCSPTLLPDPTSLRHQGARISPSFAPLLIPLTHLSLSISEFPHSEYISRSSIYPDFPSYTRGRDLSSLRLIAILNLSPNNLTHLTLTLPTSRKFEFSFALFDIDTTPEITTDPPSPHHSFLANLTHLSLSNFTLPYTSFTTFFSPSSTPSLTHLHLHDGTLETGSLVWILRFLAHTRRPSGHLTEFSLSGEWPVPEDDGTWHSRDEGDYVARCLDYEGAFATTSTMNGGGSGGGGGGGGRKGLRQLIEEYVTHKHGETDPAQISSSESAQNSTSTSSEASSKQPQQEQRGSACDCACPLPVWGRDERARTRWDEEGDASFHYHAEMGSRTGSWVGSGGRGYDVYYGVVPGDVP
ncbi:MAG: hypothetical protein Q9160_006983 [Pyrenula sp. 1 TL-2023]